MCPSCDSQLGMVLIRTCILMYVAFKTLPHRDFPGCLVVEALPSNAGGVGLIPSWGAKISHASRPKNQNNIVTKTITTLKMAHIKKIFKTEKQTNKK